MKDMNIFRKDGLRSSIAVLVQEGVDPKNPDEALFYVPSIMVNNNDICYSKNTSNIKNNNQVGNLTFFNVSEEDTIKLNVPKYITYFMEDETIPMGTKFIITFVDGNFNDPRIIGLYE